jgi:hypothetical protein
MELEDVKRFDSGVVLLTCCGVVVSDPSRSRTR